MSPWPITSRSSSSSPPAPQPRSLPHNHARYDAAGNLLNDGTHQYFYDAENRLIQVDGTAGTCTSGNTTGTTACYYYDADGRRVYRTGFTQNLGCFHNGQVGYVFDLAGHAIVANNDNDTGCVAELYAGNRHLGTSSNGVNFSHVDWLGTERMQYRDEYNIFTYCTSLPFGDDLTCSGVIDNWVMHFTGKERDAESGLDFFGARFDATNFGRFMSPDEPFADQARNDPQSWNLYTYVRNNPLRYTDADGRACVQQEDGSFETVGTEGQSCEEIAAYNESQNQVASAVVTAQADNSLLGDLEAFGLNAVISLINLPDDYFDSLTGLRVNPHIPEGQGTAATAGAFVGPLLVPEGDAEETVTSTVPKLTRWGWTRTAKWLKAIKALRGGGTKEALEGIVPTLEEAKEMIKAAGGKIERIEVHTPGGVSEHTYPHINYTTAGGQKATVRIQDLP